MREQVEARLAELRSELEAGQRRLVELERQQHELRELMLRISGAAQVLEELLSDPVAASAPAGGAERSDGAVPAGAGD
jgi:DNA repair exonuclease SbcCD ATPase subunit